MSYTVARQLRELAPAIIQRWNDGVREEVHASTAQQEAILRNSVALMLEAVARVLDHETDPKTAARLAYVTVRAEERASQPVHSLEKVMLESQVLQEAILELLGADHALDIRDRAVISRYFGEWARMAAGERGRAQTERLATVYRSKDEFLDFLGHELRNPLGALSSSLLLMSQGSIQSQLHEHALEVAHRQVEHMTQMVNDLLDIASITRGKVVLHTAPLDLGLVVQSTVEASRELFDKRQHSLTVSHKQERIFVEADRTRLAQCLSNLLTNAAKYTHSGGRIEVIVEQEGEEAFVRVRDNGIGIPRHLLPNLFELFQQATPSMDRAEGGLGIGLTVVRRLIELQGGRVEARSEGPGKGSEFSVCLPITRTGPEEPALRHPQQETTAVRVLLVEDDQHSADMLGSLLEILGHHVAVARDGPAALKAITTHRPDLAFVDIGLPGMTGYELAVELRASNYCPPSMKLVALTGYAANADALATAGFDSHIAKPIGRARLEETIASVTPTEK